jgi:hypothetical protein
LDVVSPIEIFRVVGRRPSTVWVDADMKVCAPDGGGSRLSELAYWRTRAEIGEQIQERMGGTFLVTRDGLGCHPIALGTPHPLEAASAFIHAQAVRQDDGKRIEELIASGALVEASPKRLKGPPSRPTDRILPADHPLIVEVPPAGLGQEAPSPFLRRRLGGW